MRRVLVLCLLAAGGVVALPVHAGAATGAPAVTVTPATDVSDGQFVKLSFSGFDPYIGIVFRECSAGATDVTNDCTGTSGHVATTTGFTQADGTGIAFFPVGAGSDPQMKNTAPPPTGPNPLLCDATHACVIAWFTATMTALTPAQMVPIAIAPSPDACPTPGPNGVLGSGSASGYRAMFTWESSECTSGVPVSFAVTNSVNGVADFQTTNSQTGQWLTDFGVTGPLPSAPAQTPRPYKFAPLTASGVVLAYHISDRLTQSQIPKLVLTPNLIAQIFTGQLLNWNVSGDIRALNPGINFPSREVAFARAEHSAESYVFTSWLAAAAPSVWMQGAQLIFPPPPAGVTEVTGSDGMGRAVAGVNPIVSDWTLQGNIGFMDSSTASFYGLQTAYIQMPDGSQVAATVDSITTGLNAAHATGDGTLTFDYGSTTAGAYPMVMPTYAMVPTSTLAANKASTLRAFLTYAATDGQKILSTGAPNTPDRFSYAPLTPALSSETVQVASHDIRALPSAASLPPPSDLAAAQPPAPPSASPTLAHAEVPAASPPPSPAKSAKPASIAAAPLLRDYGQAFAIPLVAGFAVAMLSSGSGMQFLARRRRAITTDRC
jgi:phosphate transport system substrate-binding protein